MVLRRQEWLQAVKDDDETKLQDLLAQALQDDDATGSVAGSGPRCQSRDQASLARAGPCAGFEKLTVLRVFSDLASNFRTCSSTADLKAANEAAVAPRKLFNTLLASCKAAVAELRSSKQRAVSAAETLRKKRAKEAETEAKKVGKKRRANSDGKGHVASHAVFQLDASDCVAMTMATAWDKEWLLETAEPFVITGADLENIDGDGGALEGFLKDFAKAFNESSLKAMRSCGHMVGRWLGGCLGLGCGVSSSKCACPCVVCVCVCVFVCLLLSFSSKCPRPNPTGDRRPRFAAH